MKKCKTIETKLICPKCGTVVSIRRKMSKQKAFGHLKKLYCYKCRERVNFFEIGSNIELLEVEHE